MNLFEDMRVFVVVVETGGFSAAAQRLNIAKSVVSRRMSALERHLECRLFNRTTRRLSLTETGLDYFERTQRILRDLAEAEEATRSLQSELRGRLRLAAPMSFGLKYLSPALNEFMRAYPGLEVELDLNDRYVDLVNEGYDITLRIGRLSDSTLVARELGPCPHAVCASPGYLAAHGRPEAPDDLREHTCLGYKNRANSSQWQFLMGREWRSVAIRPRLMANNGEVLVQAAVDGLGLVSLPRFLLAESLANGQLVEVLQDYPLPSSQIYAVCPPGRRLPAKVRAFIDFLVDRFAQQPAAG
ncbi:LysR family transcriptional regulator [Pseudomonas sp. BN102]|uniref:LysR family transcriptional regulator n=1 Tax=Pseudomonas sp. BN102 TaxID=2567886 RepID=UPI002453ABCF|nr:LysR family transcriptional regulator [Pseudomonas sp. BN102]MDH4608698.1 LysR family transcriptional regulator [Pseudomonas sp. BN102]